MTHPMVSYTRHAPHTMARNVHWDVILAILPNQQRSLAMRMVYGSQAMFHVEVNIESLLDVNIYCDRVSRLNYPFRYIGERCFFLVNDGNLNVRILKLHRIFEIEHRTIVSDSVGNSVVGGYMRLCSKI